MDAYFVALASFLLALILVGAVRVYRGPTAGDRMAGVQMFGTTKVAAFLVLAEPLEEPALHDVALALILLAAVATVAFVRRVWRPADGEEGTHVA